MSERATKPLEAESAPLKLRQQAYLLPWLLIALTPPLFALATWNTSNDIVFIQALMRYYGIPVAAIEIVVILFAILCEADPLRAIKELHWWVKASLVALLAVALWTTFAVAPQPSQSAIWTFLWVIHVLFGLSVSALAHRSASSARTIIWPAIVIGLCGYALIFLAFVNLIPDQADFDWEHLRLAVTNVRQVGFYSAVGATAALGLAIIDKARRSAIYVVAASLLLALSFWTGTRGSLIAVTGAYMIGLFWLPEIRSFRAWALLFASMIGGGALSLLQPVRYFLFGIARMIWPTAVRGADAMSSGRLEIWRGTLHAILQRPMLGYGQGQFSWVVPESNGFNHPHNVILQILLQWGLVGTLIFGALASLVIRQLRQTLSKPNPDLIAPFLVLASMLIMSLYEGTFFHTYPLMMIAFSTAMLTQRSGRLKRAPL